MKFLARVENVTFFSFSVRKKKCNFLQKQHLNIFLTVCSLQMHVRVLDVTLFKSTVLILFADWLHLDLCEMTVIWLTSIKGAVARILARHWNTGGTGNIPGKVLAQWWRMHLCYYFSTSVFYNVKVCYQIQYKLHIWLEEINVIMLQRLSVRLKKQRDEDLLVFLLLTEKPWDPKIDQGYK